MGRKSKSTARLGGADRGGEVTDDHVLSLGRLSFLATYCPLHKQFPAAALSRIFVPAINHNCVRFFSNEDDQVCAALIWARLTDEVSERMIFDQVPPTEKDWASGHNLWFLDVLAPFGHGKMVARHIARNPPDGPFFFARLGKGGKARKVVCGDASARRGRVTSYFVDPDTDQVR